MKERNIDWKIGCSGFHYREWKDTFYPKGLAASKWLSHYCEHFNTMESNTSFYKLPTMGTLEKWYKLTPEHFTFSVKAPRMITHYKKFNNVENDLAVFYSLIREGLKEKLGCVLFQLPPAFSYTTERLRNITGLLDSSFLNVVEFRHESWWNENVFYSLHEKNITFCNISHPFLPTTVIPTAPIFYYRFHGVPDIYRSSYSHSFLEEIMSIIKNVEAVKTVYLYFNNTAGMGAIENAKYLIDELNI